MCEEIEAFKWMNTAPAAERLLYFNWYSDAYGMCQNDDQVEEGSVCVSVQYCISIIFADWWVGKGGMDIFSPLTSLCFASSSSLYYNMMGFHETFAFLSADTL